MNRSKVDICQNLKVLSVMEQQEVVKRQNLDKYISLYSNIQAKNKVGYDQSSPYHSRKYLSESVMLPSRNPDMTKSMGRKYFQYVDKQRVKESF